MGKTTSSHFSAVFDQILFILAGNEDMHKSLDEFEFRPDQTTELGQIPPLTMKLAALERLKNRRHHFFSVAGNEDMHNILDEFEFRPDQTTDFGVSCP